jgi:hypothetical protein
MTEALIEALKRAKPWIEDDIRSILEANTPFVDGKATCRVSDLDHPEDRQIVRDCRKLLREMKKAGL